MKGLDSNQIATSLGKLVCPKKVKLAAVCARDEIEEVIRQASDDDSFPLCLVSNTDVSTGDGEHWVALYVNSLHECEFFDSYGCQPSVYRVVLPFTDYNLANSRTLQSQLSSVCGHYCLFYLAYRSRGVASQRIFHCFSPRSLRYNDTSVERSVHKLMKRASSSCVPHPCFTAHRQGCKCRDSCHFY